MTKKEVMKQDFKTEILAPSPENIALCSKLIKEGQVVAMPTETVYGLAGAAFDIDALTKIFEAKERPTFDPLIIHVGLEMMEIKQLASIGLIEKLPEKIAEKMQATIQALITRFWPGPLTLVLPKHASVPDLATSGLPTVALRMPKHPVAQALIKAAGKPLAAPSANRFGRISPTSAQDVLEELKGRIRFILDGGRCEIGVESTVISINPDGAPVLLRPGGISIEELENACGMKVLRQRIKLSDQGFSSPGLLLSHYAPRKKLRLLPNSWRTFLKITQTTTAEPLPETVGLLVSAGEPEAAASELSTLIKRKVIARTLSLTGNLQESAFKLFSELRWLDNSDAEIIFAEPLPEAQQLSGLGHAIMDRLNRAAASGKL